LLELLSFGNSGWLDELLLGAFGTLALLVVSFPLGLITGLGLVLLKISKEPTLRISGNTISLIIRGIPDLLLVFIFYYIGQRYLNAFSEFIEIDYLEISVYFCGVAALMLMTSAESSEIFQGSLTSMGKSSIEAGKSLGMKNFTIFRLIVLPELLRLSEPGLSNLWLITLKRTAVVSLISYVELMRQTQIAAYSTEENLFFYGIACLLYFIITVITYPLFKYFVGYYRYSKYTKK
jgi:polar amino acid transport system permease protein